MTKHSQHSLIDSGKQSPKNRKPGEHETEESSDDSCRCKEVSKKTPTELLKLMISDLAFWKKKP